MRISSRNIAVTLMLAIAVAVGVYLHKDYGISNDEPINRANGAVSTAHVIRMVNDVFSAHYFEHDPEISSVTIPLSEYHDRDYGVVLDMPLFLIERLLRIDDSRSRYHYRHIVNYLLFIFGVYFIYKTAFDIFEKWHYGIVASLMVLINPRLFAEAFYNGKDIAFMSIFMISIWTMWKYINSQNWWPCGWHALISSIAIDLRIVAIIIPAMTLFCVMLKLIVKKEYFVFEAFRYLAYSIFSVLIVFILWPWLWSSPVDHFFEAFRNMSKFRWDGWILFNGYLYPARGLPYSYLIVWIIITTPIVFLISAIIGLVKLNFGIFYAIKNKSINNSIIFQFCMLIMMAAPLMVAILFKSVVYDGWRHFYFIYPMFVIISVGGIRWVAIIIKNKYYSNILISAILVGQMLSLVIWMVQNHPFQNVYFNSLAGQFWYKKFEMDYWGLSDVKGLEHILLTEDRATVSIAKLGQTAVDAALTFLGPEVQRRVALTDDLNGADYVIYNYRDIHPRVSSMLARLQETHGVFYEINVDGHPILTIYKKTH